MTPIHRQVSDDLSMRFQLNGEAELPLDARKTLDVKILEEEEVMVLYMPFAA